MVWKALKRKGAQRGSLGLERIKRIKNGFGLLLLGLALAAAPIARAGQAKAQLRVLVQDEAGVPIAAAIVEISQKETLVATVNTDEKGTASLPNLAPGVYQVKVLKDGFEPRVQENVTLAAGPGIEITFTLVPKVQLKEEINVSATAGAVTPEQAASTSTELQGGNLRFLPTQGYTVADALPLIPGVVRSAQGEIKISGTGENRSAFIVNAADVTDPATGQFGMTVPVDSVQSINVFKTPYLAQYGRFTAGVVSVETKRGGDKWNFELNDPLPEFRYLNGNLRGLRAATPRVVFNGPLIKNKLYLSEGSEYTIKKRPVMTLEYPNKETITESINSFTQLDYLVSGTHTLTGTFHFAPRRDSYVNLDFFNRRPVTPNFKSRDYTGTVIDRLTMGQNLLESTVSVKHFQIDVWGQGVAEMNLTPTGNTGNYYSEQDRHATRVEWLETLSLRPLQKWGSHQLKFGSVLARTTSRGEFDARPVNVQDTAGRLLSRIEFSDTPRFTLRDQETYFFGQDHWTVTPRLAFDLGVRFERQGITDTYRLAPRVGLAWSPTASQKTVFRTGYGFFYDRVPLGVYAFDKIPQQTITTYDPNGTVLDGPRRYLNLINREERKGPLVWGGSSVGNFAPFSGTWNVEVEHSVTSFLRLRVNYLNSISSGVVIVEPGVKNGSDALILNGGGHSRYRQFEVTTRFSWSENKQQFFASYVRSASRGNINEFNTYIGNFPYPLVRRDQTARLGADLPNRILAWGLFQLPWKLRYSPIVEYRDGFPFSDFDERQNYVGEANSRRFPRFLSFDSKLIRDFQINPKYAVRFTLSGFNMTNHFNALDVHRNVRDPRYGVFFGNLPRFFRLDFDVLF